MIHLKCSNLIAQQALDVGATVVGGDVRERLTQYLATGLNERGAVERLDNLTRAVYHASSRCIFLRDARPATFDLIRTALAHGWPCHPDRGLR